MNGSLLSFPPSLLQELEWVIYFQKEHKFSSGSIEQILTSFLSSFLTSFPQVALVLLFKSSVTLTPVLCWKRVGNCSTSAQRNVSIRLEGSPKPNLHCPKCILYRNPKVSHIVLQKLYKFLLHRKYNILKLLFQFESQQNSYFYILMYSWYGFITFIFQC